MLTARRVFLFFALAAMLTAICAVESPALSFLGRAEADAAAAPKTNAERMRRGLTPLKPRKSFEATPAGLAARSKPSSTPPTTCPGTSTPQCCLSIGSSLAEAIKSLLKLLGIDVKGQDVPIGLTCSLFSKESKCSAHTVCCDSVKGGGLCGINCKPM